MTAEIAVKTIAAETKAPASAADSPDGLAQKQALNDQEILELAKRRLAIKKNLTYQVAEFFLILMCLMFIVFSWEGMVRFLIAFTFSLLWGIRLICRIAKFAKPSFKDGISAYLKRRNDYQLESEFNRLKQEYLNNN